MSTVSATIHIDAPPGRVWDVVMDPSRLAQWVTIHRRLRHADEGAPRVGYRMEQQIYLRGVSVEVHWQLVALTPHEQAVWEGRGPARSHARTEYRLRAENDGSTCFDYRNEFRVPLGPIGALASKALVGGMPQREASHTLILLKALIESE